MFFYVKILGSLLGLDVLVSNVDQENKKKLITIFFFTLLLILSTIRSVNVGTDMDNYFTRYFIIGETPYKELFTLNDAWGFEYGYMILNKLMFSISTNYYFYTFITSFFILFSFFRFIYKYSDNITISLVLFILLYFFGTSLNLIRLFLALSINLFGIEYLKERDFLKFSLIVVLASTFHTSALAFLLLYPLYEFKFTKESTVFLMGGLIFVGLFSTKILQFLLSFHIYGKRYGAAIGSGDGQGMFLFQILVLVALFIQQQHKKKENHLLIIMLITSIIFNIIAFDLIIAARVMWYFKPALLILVPKVLMKNKGGNLIKQLILYTVLFVYPLYFSIQKIGTDNEGIFPYETIFLQEEEQN